MEKLKRLGAAVALTLMLSLYAFAGEIDTPPAPGQASTPPCADPGQIQTPPCASLMAAPGQTDTPPSALTSPGQIGTSPERQSQSSFAEIATGVFYGLLSLF